MRNRTQLSQSWHKLHRTRFPFQLEKLFQRQRRVQRPSDRGDRSPWGSIVLPLTATVRPLRFEQQALRVFCFAIVARIEIIASLERQGSPRSCRLFALSSWPFQSCLHALPPPNKQAQLSQFLSRLSDNPWELQVAQ